MSMGTASALLIHGKGAAWTAWSSWISTTAVDHFQLSFPLGSAACQKHSEVMEKPPDQLLLPLLESQASTASAPVLTSVPGSWRTSSQLHKWMSQYSTSTAFHWTPSLHLHYHWTFFDKTRTLSTSNAINMSEASSFSCMQGQGCT